MESELRTVIRNQLSLRNFPVKENATFRLGRKNYTLDFYLKNQKIGIVTMNWKRTIPVNKVLQLERLLESLNLKKLVLICNSISENAKEFLDRRDIPIQIIHSPRIIAQESTVEDLITGY